MFSWGVIERQGDLFFWKAISKDALRNFLIIGKLVHRHSVELIILL